MIASRALSSLIVFAFVLSACSSSPTVDNNITQQQEVTNESPQLQITDQITSEPDQSPSIQTPTEIPPTLLPVSQDELIDKWYTPISSTVLVKGMCDYLLEEGAAEDAESNKFSITIGADLFVTLTRAALKEWEPGGEFEDYKLSTDDYLAQLDDLIAQWSDAKIDHAQFKTEVDNLCQDIDSYVKTVVDNAKSSGVTEDSLEKIGEKLAQAFDTPEEEIVQETPESISAPTEVGLSRQNPFPLSETQVVPNWEIKVLENIRGEEAWNMIQMANSYNDPPLEGKEYILIKVSATNRWESQDAVSIDAFDFKLTGSQLIAYTPASIVLPDPKLEAEIFSGATSEGWIAFEVMSGEDNLILIFDELENWDSDRFRYFAVDENASITIPDDLLSIEPNDMGLERQNPAAFGETVITEDWQVQVLEVIRGDEAMTLLQDANQFNSPPDEGMEYVLIKLTYRHIKPTEGFVSTTDNAYELTGSLGKVYETPYAVEPDPEIDANLFPGGEHVGWIALQGSKDETNLTLIVSPYFEFDNANRRFLSLES